MPTVTVNAAPIVRHDAITATPVLVREPPELEVTSLDVAMITTAFGDVVVVVVVDGVVVLSLSAWWVAVLTGSVVAVGVVESGGACGDTVAASATGAPDAVAVRE